MNYDNKINFLQKIFGNGHYSSTTKELVVFCPFCNHRKKKLSINLDTHYFKCWVCNKAGKDVGYLITKFGSSYDIQTYKNIYNINKISLKNELEEFKLSIPEHYIPLVNCKDSFIGKKAYNYLLNVRKITEDDILFYKIGICLDEPYKNKIIFPSFDCYGNMNFFTARTIGDGGYMLPITPRGYKNNIIINELYLDWSKIIILTEGFIDSLKTNTRNVVPLFGSTLSKHSKLFRTIVANNTPVCLALDDDAWKKSLEIAKSFMGYDNEVYLLETAPFKDLGEMSREDFVDKFNKISLLTDNYIFKKKLRMVC